MGNSISSAITHSWIASHERRVQKWLDNATEDSVLDALTTSFFPRGKGYGGLPVARNATSHIRETFSAYGSIDDIDKKRYWHEKDLELFLMNQFPGSDLSACMPILWKCFRFHAFFPFPQKPQRIDYNALQRAIGFLAAEGNLRLGGNANGVIMDADRYPDDSARTSKHLWLLFKSLADDSAQNDETKVVASDLAGQSNAEEDLMEVLALTQPDNLCIMPAPIEELRPHARRILGSSTPFIYSSIPRGDFLSLLKLVLSVQLDKPEWGNHEPDYYTGRILISPDPDILQGAADAILMKSIPSETDDVDWRSFQNILNVYLPGFTSQLHLIFTSFLSSLPTTNQALAQPAPERTIPIPYAQCLNLFLHPPLTHPKRYTFEEFARREAHYALQITQPSYTASHSTINTTDLITALGPIKTGTLLLITGSAITPNETHPPTRVVVGACMPTPWDLARERAFRASPPQKLHRYTPEHTLFQLEPVLEILRPEAADAWIMDLIHVAASNVDTGSKGSLRFGAENASGLIVDFDTGIATLRNRPLSRPFSSSSSSDDTDPSDYSSTHPSSAYHPVTPPTQNPADVNKPWSSSLRIHTLDLYDLGGDATAPFEELLVPKPRLRTPEPERQESRMRVGRGGDREKEEEKEMRVDEGELRRRVEGFGSGGL